MSNFGRGAFSRDGSSSSRGSSAFDASASNDPDDNKENNIGFSSSSTRGGSGEFNANGNNAFFGATSCGGGNFRTSRGGHLVNTVRCAAHVFNTCAKNTLKLYKNPLVNSKYVFDYDDKRNVSTGQQLLSDSIQFINIVNKKKNVLDVLGKKLQTHCETRFLSKLMCLRDLESNVETLYHSQHTNPPFIDQEEQVLFTKIYEKRRVLHVLIEIFELYEHPIISLQSSSKPTLHKVWPLTINIIENLERIGEKCDGVGKSLVKASLAALERKMAKGFITDNHKIATVLNPSTRKLGNISAIEKQRVYSKVRSMLNEPATGYNHRPLLSMETPEADEDELTEYLGAIFSDTGGENFDLLDFWYRRRSHYKQLYDIAMKVLCIPATSCSPERGFSTLKNLITDQRNQLDPKTVSKMMIGKSLLDFDSY